MDKSSAALAKETERRRSAEKKLEAFKFVYRRLYDNASDGIVLFDDREIIFNANPTFLRMLGYRFGDIQGRKVTELIHPDDLKKLPSQIKRLLAGEAVTIERRLCRKDGGYICFEQSVKRISENVIMALYRDVTERKKVEKELHEALESAESMQEQLEDALSRVNTMAMEAEVASLEMNQIFNATSDGICVIHKDRQISRFNSALQDMMTRMGFEMTKGKCADVFGHDLCNTDRCLMTRILQEDEERVEEEIEVVTAGGGKQTFIVNVQPLLDLTAEAIGVVANFKNITDRKLIEEDLRRMATIDPLTGAFNRREFMKRAQEEIDRSKRYHHPLSLLMIDIDHFKSVNDTYGHDAGDEVLKQMVAESQAQLRGSDPFYRLGGEEFAAILTHTLPEQGVLAAERLRKALKSLAVSTSGGEIHFTVSIGLASMGQGGLSLEQIMKQADTALYEAKDRGRDRVVMAAGSVTPT